MLNEIKKYFVVNSNNSNQTITLTPIGTATLGTLINRFNGVFTTSAGVNISGQTITSTPGNLIFNSNLYPSVDATYIIGNVGSRWKTGIYSDSLTVGVNGSGPTDVVITSSSLISRISMGTGSSKILLLNDLANNAQSLSLGVAGNPNSIYISASNPPLLYIYNSSAGVALGFPYVGTVHSSLQIGNCLLYQNFSPTITTLSFGGLGLSAAGFVPDRDNIYYLGSDQSFGGTNLRWASISAVTGNFARCNVYAGDLIVSSGNVSVSGSLRVFQSVYFPGLVFNIQASAIGYVTAAGPNFGQLTVQVSDSRLKSNITDTDLGLDFINSIPPVKFQELNPTDDSYVYGFLAQDIISALDKFGAKTNMCPLIKNTEYPDGRYAVQFNQLLSPLLKAVQELSAKCNELQARLDALV